MKTEEASDEAVEPQAQSTEEAPVAPAPVETPAAPVVEPAVEVVEPVVAPVVKPAQTTKERVAARRLPRRGHCSRRSRSHRAKTHKVKAFTAKRSCKSCKA